MNAITQRLARGLRRWRPMFVFYSNRLGCLGSVIASVVLTVILLGVLALINGGLFSR